MISIYVQGQNLIIDTVVQAPRSYPLEDINISIASQGTIYERLTIYNNRTLVLEARYAEIALPVGNCLEQILNILLFQINSAMQGIIIDNVVFFEEFTGNGSATQFQLSGTITNATFATGGWDASQIQIGLPAYIARVDDDKPVYDSGILFVLTRTRVEVVSVSPTGLVTTNVAPQSGVQFFVAYWYKLNVGDDLDNYVREDFVAGMEADLADINARIDLKLDADDPDHAANTAARHTHANQAILDATTASFTTAHETNLNENTTQRIVTVFASADPLPTDNSYSVGRTRWLNETSNEEFTLVDITAGVATWKKTTLNGTNEFDYIDFTTTVRPPYKEGRVWYDPDTNCLNIYNDKTQLTWQLGREFLLEVKNVTGSVIPDGKPVYITGVDSGYITVDLAIASSFATASVIGVITISVPIGGIGEVTILGAINDLDTSAFPAGSLLYLSDTVAGDFTTIPPPLPVVVAQVTISHATQGQIYIYPNRLPGRSNRVRVRGLEDLPAPIASVIQLRDDVIYEVVGDVNLGGNSLSLGNNCALTGYNPVNDKITYTGTGYAVIAEDVNGLVEKLEINASTGTVFNIVNTTGNEKTSEVSVRRCVITPCDVFADIENIGRVIIRECDVADTVTDGIVMIGSQNGTFLFLDNIVRDFTGVWFKLGTSIWDSWVSNRNTLFVDTGRTGISGQINNGNLSANAKGRITANYFSGNGTYVLNIDTGGTRWDFLGNDGVDDITDNIATGFASMEDNATLTDIVTQNVWVKIAGTTVAGSNNLRFSMPVNNRLRYDGDTSYKGNITVTGDADINTRSNIYEVAVFKNGVKIPNVKIGFQVVNGKPNGFAITAPVDAITNDYFEAYIRCTDGNKDVTVADLNMSIG